MTFPLVVGENFAGYSNQPKKGQLLEVRFLTAKRDVIKRVFGDWGWSTPVGKKDFLAAFRERGLGL